MMRSLGILCVVSVITIGCGQSDKSVTTEKESTTVTRTPQPAPAPGPVVVVPSTAELKNQLDGIQDQIRSLAREMDDTKRTFRADFDTAVQRAINPATANLESSVRDVRNNLRGLEEKFQSQHSELERKLDMLNAQGETLSQQLSEQVKINNTNSDTLRKIALEIEKVRSLAHHSEILAANADSNARLGLLALKEVGEKKTGGFLGIGGKHLLPESTREEIVAKTTSETANTNVVQQP